MPKAIWMAKTFGSNYHYVPNPPHRAENLHQHEYVEVDASICGIDLDMLVIVNKSPALKDRCPVCSSRIASLSTPKRSKRPTRAKSATTASARPKAKTPRT